MQRDENRSARKRKETVQVECCICSDVVHQMSTLTREAGAGRPDPHAGPRTANARGAPGRS